MRRAASWLLLSGAVIAADQASKYAIRQALEYGHTVVLTPFFNLVLTMNAGAAFSFLSRESGWQRWFFIALALAVSAWLVTLIRKHASELWVPLAGALILGGALGNVIDRMLFGAVVDFIQWHIGEYYWPAFNVADSAITVGVAFLIWDQLRPRAKQPDAQAR